MTAASTTTASRARWRLLLTAPLPGVENMALDAALMARARRTGETVLRVYGWSVPTLSLGRNQSAAGRYPRDRVAAAVGTHVVRRPTGGRAILHHREITYSVTAPVGEGQPRGAAAESYARINRLLIDALAALGVATSVAMPAVRAPRPGLAPCFDQPVGGELVTDGGRKLVGSAQLLEDGALLQHGSILVDDDQTMLETMLPDDVIEARRLLPQDGRAGVRPATLRSLLGRAPSLAEMAAAMGDAVRAREDPDARALALDPATIDDARHAALTFAADDWTWRR